MCEGPSSISGPIPPDPSLFPQYYKRPASGGVQPRDCGVIIFFNTILYLDIAALEYELGGPNATHILERGQKGVVGELLKIDSISISPVPKQSKQPFLPSEQRVMHDFGKENVRRLREIQKRSKEQEAERAQSRAVPVKALWTASKYQNVPSRVMAQLQARSISCQNFLKAHSYGGSASPQRPQSKTSRVAEQRRASCNSTQDLDLQVRIAKVLLEVHIYILNMLLEIV
uniref:Enkurin domain containing 1 n=1 Tax=Pundamilia nyererei TaxID=303518 RepID=A0A3B4FJ78_9CICH